MGGEAAHMTMRLSRGNTTAVDSVGASEFDTHSDKIAEMFAMKRRYRTSVNEASIAGSDEYPSRR